MNYTSFRVHEIEYGVEIIFNDKECEEFLSVVKRAPRKIKKTLKRIAKKEPSILEVLGIEKDSKEITFWTKTNGKIHRWLKKCDSKIVQDKAVNAKSYKIPISICWNP